jgi:hypothetical protein
MASELRILSSDEYKMWDDFVYSSPNGTIFHKTFWLKSSGNNFDIYGLFGSGNLSGGFVAPYRKFLGEKVIAPMPLSPYSGIVFPDYKGKYVGKISSEKELSAELAAFLRKRYKWGSLSFSPLVVDMQPFIWNGFNVRVGYTYILNISNIDECWNGMDAKRRNDITKAQKDGLVVLPADSFNDVIELVKKTFRRQEISPSWKETAYRYYDELNKRNLCKGFICADKQGNKIATAFIVWDEKRAYCLLGGYDTENKHHGASAMCVWEAIKFVSIELGLREFDFEGSTIPQIEPFVRKFGGRLTSNYKIQWGWGWDTVVKTRAFLKKCFRK